MTGLDLILFVIFFLIGSAVLSGIIIEWLYPEEDDQ